MLFRSGFLTLLLWPHYTGFLAGEALLGLGHAVLSGPPATILYETLTAHGQPHRYLAAEARLSALRLLGTGSSFLIGGLLVASTGGYEAAIAATALGNAVAALLALRLRRGPSRPQWRAQTFLTHVGDELRKPAVRWLLGYCDGDRAAARALWRPMQRRTALQNELERALAMATFTYILSPFRQTPRRTDRPR